VSGRRLDVGVPAGAPLALTIEYRYQDHGGFQGASPAGYTLLWPYHCGNLFPCKSDPADGLRFDLALSGVEPGKVALFPATIAADAPSYMIAWAVGDYTHLDLGATAAGTRVGAWHLPGTAAATTAGTAHLRQVVDWLERTLGPYPYGDEVASVEVAWGPGAYGGMEHHPLWHVASAAMGDPETHAHEAAHGWFGNGIRIACWEDFVLSEGAVSYLAARALAEVAGSEVGDQIWSSYQGRLDRLQSSAANKIAWPEGCGDIDILIDGLFGTAPYMKGAFFFRALEERVGAAALDAALAGFFAERGGQAARMQDLLDRIQADTGYDPGPCALAWLRSESVPAGSSCP
jgi:aminopeptidase N